MKLKIWVVEDDPIYRQMLTSYLGVLGHQSEGFTSGEECIAYLQESPDVIILDYHLGNGINGLDVLRKIKDIKKKISVICLSGEERASIVADTFRNGSEDYIGKDSASLLRLKLRLDRIKSIHHLQNKKRKKQFILSIATATLVSLLAVLVYKLFI